MGKRERVMSNWKGFSELVTAQLSLDGGGRYVAVGESEANKVFPGQEASEPEAFGGESKAETGAVLPLRNPWMLTMQMPGPHARRAEQNSGTVSRSVPF